MKSNIYIITGIILLGLIPLLIIIASAEDIQKSYSNITTLEMSPFIKDGFNSKFGIITMTNTKDERVAEYSLISTSESIIDINMNGKAKLYQNGTLFDDIKFKNIIGGSTSLPLSKYYILIDQDNYVDVPDKTEEKCEILPEIDPFKQTCYNVTITYKKVNQPIKAWSEYKNTILTAGEYNWKWEGKRNIGQMVDAIPVKSSNDLDEWTWYNTTWTKKKQLNISGNTIPLTNFVVYVNITYDSDMDSNFKDIRFANATETGELFFEFDHINSSNSAGVWIKFPTLNAGERNNTIYMYYANTSLVQNGQNPASVWTAYARVFHLDEMSATTANESAAGKNATIKGGNTTMASAVSVFGNSMNFNKTRGVNLSNYGNVFGQKNVSICGWFKSSSEDTLQRFGWDYEVSGDAWARTDWNNAAADKIQVQAYNGGTITLTNSTQNVTRWLFVCQTMRLNGEHAMYINGTKTGNQTAGALTQVGGRTMGFFGSSWSYNLVADPYPWHGFIDEFKMASGQLSAQWINRDYQNANMSKFVFGGEESSSTQCSPTINVDWIITDAQVCNGVAATAGTGGIIITSGTLSLINGANVTAESLNITQSGDKVFIASGSQMKL